ncbi:MAG: hypothetical protein F6K28_45270, partial [Microcoleus sp. SIO2G3]|nr:hypothetical protein [Microcoleus sp. SIO2G3]
SPEQANDAFVLQADELFQQYLKDYAEASATRSALLSKWLPDSPTVLKATAEQDAAQASLLSRSRTLLGKPIDEQTLHRLNLKPSAGQAQREQLLSELISTQAEQKALTDQVQSLERQIAQLESRLKSLSQEELNLEKFGRDSQVAQTVFSSTLAKLDLSQTDTSDSYPPVQVVSEPSLPENPSFPIPKIVLLGALAGSFLVTAGLVLLWLDRQGLLKLFAPEEYHAPSPRKP